MLHLPVSFGIVAPIRHDAGVQPRHRAAVTLHGDGGVWLQISVAIRSG